MWFDIGALMFLTGVFSMIVLLFQRVDNKMQRFWLFFAILLGAGLGCIFSVGMTLIVESAADEAGTVAISGLAQGIGFTGGGLLAWMGGMCMQCAHRDLWMGGIYTLFALLGLICGLQALRKPGGYKKNA